MLTREVIEQLRHLLRPIAVRVANTAARAVVRLVDDSTKMQLLQIELLRGEVRDGAEHFQPYGVSAVPVAGAEAVVVFPGGDRSHPLVVAVSDRGGKRPTGGQPGDVTVYSPGSGAKARFLATGDIELEPAAGKQVLVREAGGTAQRLLTEQDGQILRAALNTATIALGAAGAAGVVTAMDLAVAALPSPPTPPQWPIRTKTLEGE